jgi:preprotein translocase subunit SecD
VFDLFVCEASRVDECAFDDEAAERVANEYDRAFGAVFDLNACSLLASS